MVAYRVIVKEYLSMQCKITKISIENYQKNKKNKNKFI